VLFSPHIHLQDLQIMILPAALLVAGRLDKSKFDVLLPAALFVLAPLALAGANLVTPVLAGSLAYQVRQSLPAVSLRWRAGQAAAQAAAGGRVRSAWRLAGRLVSARRDAAISPSMRS